MAYQVGQFVLDDQRFELRRAGMPVAIEPQVLSILLLLIQNRERLVTKDEIIEKIWNGRIVSDSAVSSRVKSARHALLDDGKRQAVIRTVHGRGFRFVGAVDSPIISAAPANTANSMPAEDGLTRDMPPFRLDGAKPSIAVLPFRITGEARSFAYFAEAIPHELIAELSRLRWLFVIARGSSFRFRAPHVDVGRVGQRLDVGYCLTGTIEQAGNRIAMTVELADTRSRGIVWGDRYEADASDLFALRHDLVPRIVSALEVQIPFHEAYQAQRTATEDLDAWAAFHLGLRHMFRFTKEGNAASLELFRRALQLDPHFGRAHAGMSFAHFQNAFLSLTPDPDAQAASARRYAERAVEIDALDPFANFTLGRSLWLSGAVEDSLGWLGRATELSPNYAQAIYSRALAETALGAGADGQRDADTAMALSPLDPLHYAMLATRALSHVVRGDDAIAMHWAERAARAPGAHVIITLIAAACADLNGAHDQAAHWAASARGRHATLRRADFFRSLPFRDIAARGRLDAALARLGF